MGKQIIQIRRFLFSRMLHNRPSFQIRYLKLAKFLSTYDIATPLASTSEQAERKWREQGLDLSKVDPEVYTRYDDSVIKAFEDVLPLLNPDSHVLEIGCGSGRNLDYLYQKGFHNLTGIEIGYKAIELFASTYPDTYNYSTIIEGNAVEKIKELEEKSFDLVFTHGVLVNIPVKNNNIFYEMCRVCKGYILTLESEGSWTAFPRYFQKMFRKNGFAMVAFRWLVPSNNEDGALEFPNPIAYEHVFVNCTIRLFAPVAEKAIRI